MFSTSTRFRLLAVLVVGVPSALVSATLRIAAKSSLIHPRGLGEKHGGGDGDGRRGTKRTWDEAGFESWGGDGGAGEAKEAPYTSRGGAYQMLLQTLLTKCQRYILGRQAIFAARRSPSLRPGKASLRPDTIEERRGDSGTKKVVSRKGCSAQKSASRRQPLIIRALARGIDRSRREEAIRGVGPLSDVGVEIRFLSLTKKIPPTQVSTLPR